MDLRLEIEGKKPASTPVIMELLSQLYGWTPTQIREQPAEDIEQYVEIIFTRNKLEAAQMRKMNNKYGR